MKDVKPEIRETGVTEIGKESPGSFIESYCKIFLLEAAKHVLRGIAKEKVMGIELNVRGKELDLDGSVEEVSYFLTYSTTTLHEDL